ncbi:MAG: hypothetical protein R3264_02520 [Anaerolineae bacterium]|nr:hypothetical protein [Anaerolineae bacterium]
MEVTHEVDQILVYGCGFAAGLRLRIVSIARLGRGRHPLGRKRLAGLLVT